MEPTTFLCKSPLHEGDRNTPSDKRSGQSLKCKGCVNAEAKAKRNERKEKSSNMLVNRFPTAESWLEWNGEREEWNFDKAHKHVTPKQEEFANEEEYLRAMEIEKMRKQYQYKHKYRPAENTKRKEQYHENKTTDEGRELLKAKQKVDDENKRKRKQTAIESGQKWCEFGSHAVDPQHMTFCPVEDLGLSNSRPGHCEHATCMKHYAQRQKIEEAHREKRDAKKERFYDSKFHAASRGLDWKITEDKANELLSTMQCFYCGIQAEEHTSFGFDRMNPFPHEYSDENTVLCCKACNYAKGSFTVDEFVQACHNVWNFQSNHECAKEYIPYRMIIRKPANAPDTGPSANAWTREDVTNYTNQMGDAWRMRVVTYKNCMNYHQFKYFAGRRGYDFEISKPVFDALTSKGCFYCGYENVCCIGLDRVNNEQGYTADNVVPACTTCNFMKRNLTKEEFNYMIHHLLNKFK